PMQLMKNRLDGAIHHEARPFAKADKAGVIFYSMCACLFTCYAAFKLFAKKSRKIACFMRLFVYFCII
ncbi:MAG: hypothetical protein MR216_08595, partial [Bacteroidales bacterium]|nr:hypothetical protein [Bacteroidales bacterium]